MLTQDLKLHIDVQVAGFARRHADEGARMANVDGVDKNLQERMVPFSIEKNSFFVQDGQTTGRLRALNKRVTSCTLSAVFYALSKRLPPYSLNGEDGLGGHVPEVPPFWFFFIFYENTT